MAPTTAPPAVRDRVRRKGNRAAGGGSAREIAGAVRRDLDAFRGRRQHRDDVTLVVIKVTQAPAGSAPAVA